MKNIINSLLITIINAVFVIVVSIVGLRIILRLFGANSSNDFVNWIYETSGEIISPFRNIFSNANLDGFVIDFNAIFALFVYVLVAYGLYAIIDTVAEPRKK